MILVIECMEACLTSPSSDCPGSVDQKKPLQSGSSKMYGRILVSSRTQFKTEIGIEKILQTVNRPQNTQVISFIYYAFMCNYITRSTKLTIYS